MGWSPRCGAGRLGVGRSGVSVRSGLSGRRMGRRCGSCWSWSARLVRVVWWETGRGEPVGVVGLVWVGPACRVGADGSGLSNGQVWLVRAWNVGLVRWGQWRCRLERQRGLIRPGRAWLVRLVRIGQERLGPSVWLGADWIGTARPVGVGCQCGWGRWGLGRVVRPVRYGLGWPGQDGQSSLPSITS